MKDWWTGLKITLYSDNDDGLLFHILKLTFEVSTIMDVESNCKTDQIITIMGFSLIDAFVSRFRYTKGTGYLFSRDLSNNN